MSDELEDLYAVTYTPDFLNIIVAGRVRPLPTLGYERYIRLAERCEDDPERRKILLSIAKWIADQEAEYSRKVHTAQRYEQKLPDTVRRLEAEIQDLKDRVAALESS